VIIAMAADDITSINFAWFQAIRDSSGHLCSIKSFNLWPRTIFQ